MGESMPTVGRLSHRHLSMKKVRGPGIRPPFFLGINIQ